ncbi:hypothetical protein GPU89_19830 [Burkholderia cepacia]|nr:hypothetical protein [Burkholderia cepacia]
MDASYFSPAAIRSARRIVKEKKIDMLEVHSSHLAFFRKFFPALPAVLVSHNIESDLFPFWIPAQLTGWKKQRSRASPRSAAATPDASKSTTSGASTP